MSVSIVAMVNNSVSQSKEYSNSSQSACPSNLEEIQMDLLPEVKIEGEFDWSPSVQGYIVGAGFLGYVITQIPGGLLAEAYGAKTTMVCGIFISSACHIVSPFVSWTHSYLMIFTQFVRGLGQGLLPAAHCVVAANWFPSNERGLLNTIAMSGYGAGALVGGSLSGVICSSRMIGGWPLNFYIFGGLGILFALSFQLFFFENPRDHPKISDKELKYIQQNQETDMSKKRPPTPWRQMLTSVPVITLFITLIPQFWVGTYFLSVHPIFMGTILHFPVQENGFLSSAPFLLQTLFTLAVSWVSNWLQRNNYVGVDKLRKGFNFLCFFGYVLLFLGIYAAGCNKWMSVTLSVLAIGFNGIAFAGSMIVAVDMSPTFAGSLMGMACTFASTTGFILPVVVGSLTNEEQSLEQWNKVFFLSMGLSLFSGLVFCIFGSADVQPWNFSSIEEYQNYKMHCKGKTSTMALEAETNADVTIHL